MSENHPARRIPFKGCGEWGGFLVRNEKRRVRSVDAACNLIGNFGCNTMPEPPQASRAYDDDPTT